MGMAQGGVPSCGGSRLYLAAWGEPTRPGFPLGGTGKGGSRFPSLWPPAVLPLWAHLHVSFATADSPCFHSHSLWSRLLRCQLVSSISNGCCHLGAELSVSLMRELVTAARSQSPEPGDLRKSELLNPLFQAAAFFFCCTVSRAWLSR